MRATMRSSILILCLLCAMLQCAETIRYKNQEAYNDFLDMVARYAIEEETDREDKFIFADKLAPVSESENRHGERYIKCFEFNTTLDPGMNVRCAKKSGNFLPTCHITYDVERREVTQGCFHMPIEASDTCHKECKLDLMRRSYQGRPIYKSIGFCCCTTPLCNANAQKIIEDAIGNEIGADEHTNTERKRSQDDGELLDSQ